MSAPARPRYRKPPLVEVVLGFNFARVANNWDSVYFGKFHDRIADLQYTKIETIAEATIRFSPGPAAPSVASKQEVKRFTTEDGSSAITLGPVTVGVSMLPPRAASGYSGWEALKAIGMRIQALYRELTRPTGIVSVGLRYINAIPIEPASFRVGDILDEGSGLLPPAAMNEQQPFMVRFERFTAGGPQFRVREAIQVTARPAGNAGQLLLDTDEVAQFASGARVAEEGLAGVADLLHNGANAVFEGIIRPEVRATFDPFPANQGE